MIEPVGALLLAFDDAPDDELLELLPHALSSTEPASTPAAAKARARKLRVELNKDNTILLSTSETTPALETPRTALEFTTEQTLIDFCVIVNHKSLA